MSDANLAKPERRFRFAAMTKWLHWRVVLPVAVAVAWGVGFEAVAIVLVALIPACLALDGRLSRRPGRPDPSVEVAAGHVLGRAALAGIIDTVLDDCAQRNRTTALLLIQIDDLHVADGGWGSEAGSRIMDRVMQRISTTLRGRDIVMRSAEDSAVVALAPTRHADLGTIMTIVDRIQVAIAEPIPVAGRSVRVHSRIGICSEAMAPARGGAALLAAADCALGIARRNGKDTVRAFDSDIRIQVETDHRLAIQVEDALASGAIRPWFQPQICARTGRLAGFEALARWQHPELGVLLPGRFLAMIVSTGRSSDLGDRILQACLEALIEWDGAGIAVPCVGVNVSLEELTDPRFSDRFAWQLDRHDIAPSRIAVEILETVTLRDGNETVIRNIRALRTAGFRLDLDDFGTGAASIAQIARFGVHRIKIDRSFVRGIDTDPKQRDVVAAILGLAERLGIETLAEGVETAGEQATLAALGCPHLQGFAIAAPMPFDETIGWVKSRICDGTSLEGMTPRGNA